MYLSLLEQTECTKFFYSAEMMQKVHDLQAEKVDLKIFDVQPFDDMIRGHSNHYPYEEGFVNVRWNPILILYSSGLTGPPKPIEMNHATFAVADNDRNLPTVKGRKTQNYALWNFPGDGGRYFSSFPPFYFYGQTETGAVQALVPSREDWASLEWHPLYGADVQPSMDNAYEMVLHRNPQLEGIRSLSCNFPHVQEWHTKDLFRPHPSKPNLWQFHGRTDDIIVLSNGEKFNPVPSEAIITNHPLLSGALIVGQGKFQAALVVETKRGVKTDSLVEDIWPTVEQANLQAPSHGRIIRSMVAVAPPDKPFERAGKGTVIRKQTAEKSASEIEALYSNNNLESLRNGPILVAANDLDSIQEYVRASINLSFTVPDIKVIDDLYVLGLDSVKTVEITGLLKAGLKVSDTSWLSSQTLYTNPTIFELSKVIHKRLNSPAMSSVESNGFGRSRTTRMASIEEKYTHDLPQTPSGRDELLKPSKLVVLLTGSTGSLGIHLLRALLDDPDVLKIYCLDRSPNAQQRQEKNFAKLGLEYDLGSGKVEFLKADYGQNQFGLSADRFDKLTGSVDVLIHNAWKVDFNHSLESFEPVHIQDEPVPETPVDRHDVALEMGYGESKNVSERILGVAHKKSGVPVSILRIGQIAGPLMAQGAWNEDEWLPSLIKTSKSLGCLPDYIPDINWSPVDTLATIILEIVHFAVTTDTAWIYNLMNHKPIRWLSLVDTVAKRLGPHTQVIPLREWIKTLEGLNGNDPHELTTKPAIKILDFYQGFEGAGPATRLKYSMNHGIEASKTMAELPPVNSEWMGIWLNQWGY